MNLSNMLSILRIILALPVAYFVYQGDSITALIIGAVAGITDFLDGYFARRLNQITELGKILDPVADKVLVGFVALAMILNELMPVWFFVAVILRDILILLGGMYLKNKYKVVPSSNFEGKVTFALILVVLSGVILNFEYAALYGYYLCAAALGYSFVVYLQSMLEIINNNKK